MRSLLLSLLLLTTAWSAETVRLTITARDDQGRPVAGLWVWGLPEADGRHDRTDARGRLVADGLTPGIYDISLHHQPYHEWCSGPVTLKPGDNTLEAVLWPLDADAPAALFDVLVIGRDGQPARNTEVEVDTECQGDPPAPDQLRLGGLGMFLRLDRYREIRTRQRGIMTTNGEGRLRFQAPAGPQEVCITARHEEARGQRVWAPAGRVTFLRAYLAEGTPVGDSQPPSETLVKRPVRVVDAGGQPMARLPLAVGTMGDEGPAFRQVATTDDQGRFELPWREDAGGQVCVKAAGWRRSDAAQLDPKSAEPLTLRLTEPAGRLSGRVTDTDGRALPDAVAWAVPIGAFDRGDVPYVDDRQVDSEELAGIPGMGAGGRFRQACDAEGRFTFDQLDAVGYRLMAVAPGYGLPTSVDARPGDASPTLQLTRLAGLTGRVFRPDGQPWAGAPLRLSWGQEQPASVNADGTGRWRLADVPPGQHTFHAWLPECQELTTTLVPVGGETTSWTLRAVAGHTLTGRLLDADGRPLAACRLSCPQPESETRWAWTDANGRFKLTGLRSGDRQIDVDTADGREAPRCLRLPQPAPVTLRLVARATLSGRVLTRDGQPIAGADCQLSLEGDGDYSRRCTSDATGRYAFVGVRPLPAHLSVEHDRYLSECQELTLRPGEHARQTLRLALSPSAGPPRPTGSVVGRVLGVDGQPVAGAEVTCDDRGFDGDQRVETDAQGVYRLPKVVAGRVTADAIWHDCPSDDVAGEVKAGAETRLPDIRLLRRPVTGRLLNLPPGLSAACFQVVGGLVAVGADGQPLPDSAGRLMAPLPAGGEHGDPSPRGPITLALTDTGWLAFPGAARATMPMPLLMICMEPTSVKADGTFELPMSPGRQRLIARTFVLPEPNGAWVTLANALIDVPASGPAVFDLPVSLGNATLTGRLTLPKRSTDDEQYPWSVAAYPPGSWTPAAVAFTQPDGTWRLPGLAAGEYRLTYGAASQHGRFTRATARAGETVTVPCPSDGALTLRGRVRGKLPPTLCVTAESDTAAASARVGADGRFAIAKLPPGSYRLRLWAGVVDRLVDSDVVATLPGSDVVLEW